MVTQPPASESQLRNRLAREGLSPTRWANGPHAVYGVHDHPYGKVLLVVSGSITFTLGQGTRVVSMRPSDRLDLPPHTPHSARVGPDGVVCLEAHIP
jgi:quercetin dioxygenase-like cupin family protein